MKMFVQFFFQFRFWYTITNQTTSRRSFCFFFCHPHIICYLPIWFYIQNHFVILAELQLPPFLIGENSGVEFLIVLGLQVSLDSISNAYGFPRQRLGDRRHARLYSCSMDKKRSKMCNLRKIVINVFARINQKSFSWQKKEIYIFLKKKLSIT